MRRIIYPLLAVAASAAVAGVGGPAAAQPASVGAPLPSVSCTASVTPTVTATGVTVTGSVTCTGLVTLALTTTVSPTGIVGPVTSLLTALPNVPLPILSTIPALGATAACSVLANNTTGVTVTSSCSA